MKNLLTLFFVLIIILAKAGDPFYGGVICASKINNSDYTSSIQDLKFYLSAITKRDFKITSGNSKDGEGIFIQLNPAIDAGKNFTGGNNNRTIESFSIDGDGQRLILSADHPMVLVLGIYTYLDKLGVKWYFPGEEWTIVPFLKDIRLRLNEFVSPSFGLRDFFGTGGIVSVSSLSSNNLQEEWHSWKRRNRMGGEVSLAGHYGESFNLTYRRQLESNNEYLALVNGKRVWDVSSKWCVSNKGFRNLFINDRVSELKRQLKANQYPNQKITVSVDPSDGAGDCECDACKKLGPVSNRYYFLANEVGAAFSSVSSSAFVNLYAYDSRAAVPTFNLRENVIVQIIPYAFQKFAPADEMISKWKTFHRNLYVYDYYGLPDWHWDLPLTKGWSPFVLGKKVNFWKEQGIRGYLFESGYSIASPGFGLYLAARLGWNSKESISTISTNFYKQLFGNGATPMRSYFEKVANDYSGEADIPYLIDLLDKASNLANDKLIQQRINSFKAYVHYLKLYYAWQKSDPERIDDMAVKLYQYVLKIYSLRIIHSSRIAQMLVQKIKDQDQWRLYEPIGKGVSKIRELKQKEIVENFEEDKYDFPLLEDFEYNKVLNPEVTINNRSQNLKSNSNGMLILNFPETFVKSSASGNISFQLKVNELSKDNETQLVRFELNDTVTNLKVYNTQLNLNRNWQKVNINLAPNKIYKLTLNNSNWVLIDVPFNQWMAFTNIPTYSVLGKLWFYVPGKSKYVYYSNSSTEQPLFYDNAGKLLSIKKIGKKDLYRVDLNGKKGWFVIDSTEYKFLQFHSSILFFPHSNFKVAN